MEDKEIKYYVYTILIVIGLLSLTALCLTSCSHRVYVPVQSIRTDTIYMSRKDSVHIKDSLITRQRSYHQGRSRTHQGKVNCSLS